MSEKTILVVEDNIMNLELTQDLLVVAGFNVIPVTSAEEAINQARTLLPDLILMDVALPGMDGLTAAQILKLDAVTAGIPVVALTAQAMAGDQARVLAAGCDGYIAKPINAHAFAASVNRYLVSARSPGAAGPGTCQKGLMDIRT